MQDLLLEPTDERGVVAALEGFTQPLACVFKARAISKHLKSPRYGAFIFCQFSDPPSQTAMPRFCNGAELSRIKEVWER